MRPHTHCHSPTRHARMPGLARRGRSALPLVAEGASRSRGHLMRIRPRSRRGDRSRVSRELPASALAHAVTSFVHRLVTSQMHAYRPLRVRPPTRELRPFRLPGDYLVWFKCSKPRVGCDRRILEHGQTQTATRSPAVPADRLMPPGDCGLRSALRVVHCRLTVNGGGRGNPSPGLGMESPCLLKLRNCALVL